MKAKTMTNEETKSGTDLSQKTPLTDALEEQYRYITKAQPNKLEDALQDLFEQHADLECQLADWKDNASRDIKQLTLQLENANAQLAEAVSKADVARAVYNATPEGMFDNLKQLGITPDLLETKGQTDD